LNARFLCRTSPCSLDHRGPAACTPIPMLRALRRVGLPALVMLILTSTPVVGCHNTARGVKADTGRALEKTGQKLERAGDKIEDRNDRKDKR
jgi:predicted small secreted protein